VWADEIADGSGYGIFERVFDHNGVPLLPEFQVNTTTTENQVRPLIVVDSIVARSSPGRMIPSG